MKLKNNIKIEECNDLDEISNVTFDYFIDIHNQNKKRFYITPGGSTPKMFYSLISKKVKDWHSTSLLLSDERSDYSNYKMVNKYCIKNINNLKPNIFKYPNHFKKTINSKDHNFIKTIINKKIQLGILGMGTDGHTAGIFPDSNIKIHSVQNGLIYSNYSHENFSRLSLPYNLLMRSDLLIIMVSGREKSIALRNAFIYDYDPNRIPIQYLIYNYKKPIKFICDREALKNI